MPQLDVFDIDKNKVSTIELSSDVFEAPVKQHLLHQAVNWQLAKKRSGTASTKTRSEVRGGGSKPWKQKHMGRARHGSIRSPLWRKGGVTFGPKPKDWSHGMNKKTRKAALKSALAVKLSNDNIVIIDEFSLPEIKTKQVAEFAKKFDLKSAVIVIAGDNENLQKSARNIRSMKVLKVDGLNVYDLLRFNTLVLTQESVAKAEEGLKQ